MGAVATYPVEELGIGAASAPIPAGRFHTNPKHFARQPLTPAEAIVRARKILATPDQLYSTEEGRRIFAALISGIDSGYAFPKPVDPLKKFTV